MSCANRSRDERPEDERKLWREDANYNGTNCAAVTTLKYRCIRMLSSHTRATCVRACAHRVACPPLNRYARVYWARKFWLRLRAEMSLRVIPHTFLPLPFPSPFFLYDGFVNMWAWHASSSHTCFTARVDEVIRNLRSYTTLWLSRLI